MNALRFQRKMAAVAAAGTGSVPYASPQSHNVKELSAEQPAEFTDLSSILAWAKV